MRASPARSRTGTCSPPRRWPASWAGSRLRMRSACVFFTGSARRPASERAAVRWLERFLAERRPTLEQVSLAVGALAELRTGDGAASMFTLKRLVRQA